MLSLTIQNEALTTYTSVNRSKCNKTDRENENRYSNLWTKPLENIFQKKILTFAFLVLIGVIANVQKTTAMEYSQVNWQGLPALLAKGPIDIGDRNRLIEALSRTPTAIHGHKIILLDSPGGLVSEALAISDLFDTVAVHTVVPYGAECLSACGSIVYLGGNIKTVELGGFIGQHTCYDTQQRAVDQACNDLVGQHAFEHGHSHGSTYAFMSAVDPDEMTYFSQQEAECWGLSRYYDPARAFYKSRIQPEPCIFSLLNGKKPETTSGWRISFLLGGAYTFSRGIADDELSFELRLYCQERNPGILYLSLLIPMKKDEIDRLLLGASFILNGLTSKPQPTFTNSISPSLTEVGIIIPSELTLPFLNSKSILGLSIELEGYNSMGVWTSTDESHDNLLFAANNCRTQRSEPNLPVFP